MAAYPAQAYTLKLRGRARQITSPCVRSGHVGGLLDRGAVDERREEDADRAAEKRRKSVMKKLTLRERRNKARRKGGSGASPLRGWDEFDAD